MALHTPPDIYSAGAVEMNPQSSVNTYAQLLQKKQAREEALESYEMNRINRINEAGVRHKDRELFDKKLMDLKLNYGANKDKINKRNTPEAFNYETMWQDLSAFLNETKDRTALDESSLKYYKENFKSKNQLPDEFWKDYVANDLAIGAEGSKRMDLNKYLQMQAPAYDTKKALAPYTGFKRSSETTLREMPGDKFSQIPVTKEYFSDEDKGKIASIARGQYMTDWSVMNKVDKMIDNPLTRGHLEKTFKDEFGTFPQDKSDYAVADVMQQLQSTRVTEGKPIGKWKERAEMLQQFKRENIAATNWYRQQAQPVQDFFINDIIDDNLIEAQRGNGEFVPSQLVANSLGVGSGILRENAEKMRVLPDGNFEYLRGRQWIPISANTYKAHLRDIFTAKSGAGQAQKPKPTGKKRVYKGLDKNGNPIFE